MKKIGVIIGVISMTLLSFTKPVATQGDLAHSTTATNYTKSVTTSLETQDNASAMYQGKQRKFAVSLSDGMVFRNSFFSTLLLDNLSNTGDSLPSLTVSYRLDASNPVSGFFKFSHAIVEPTLGVAYWVQKGKNIPETDAYLTLRWVDFPWNNKLATTMAFSEGFSYVTDIPDVEVEKTSGSKHFLNYLMVEMSLANPKTPYLQYFVRLHHRSGIWGTYGSSLQAGSNVVGFGVRYYLI